jgi:hypothetical protein
MSVMGASSPADPDNEVTPRVRRLARDAVVRMAFSATCSVGIAALLLLLAHGLGR